MTIPPTKPAALQTATAPAAAPRVLEIKLRSAGKRRYSRGLGDAQRMQRGWAKAAARASEAVATGFATYRDRSEASARARRDGAIRDGLENWARATSKALKKASRVPEDVIKPMNTRRVRRAMRALIRLAALPLFGR